MFTFIFLPTITNDEFVLKSNLQGYKEQMFAGPALIFFRPGVKPQSGALYTCMTLTVLNVNTYI